MNRHVCLEWTGEALSDRSDFYGEPKDNFHRIALLWNAYLKARREPADVLDEADVAIMCALLKIARLANDESHADSWIDAAGYMACGAECANARFPIPK